MTNPAKGHPLTHTNAVLAVIYSNRTCNGVFWIFRGMTAPAGRDDQCRNSLRNGTPSFSTGDLMTM